MRTLKSSSRGFTLSELLVVVSIIGLLAAIVAPVLSRGFDFARRVKCASNLYHLGQAYHLRMNDKHADPNNPNPISPNVWVSNLQPYLEDANDETIVCPDDTDPNFGTIDVGLQIWVSEERDVPTEYATELFNVYPYWLEGSCPDPGPGIWKLNNEMFETFKSEFVGSQDYAPSWLPRYTPGADPKSWWLVIEEGRLNGGGAGSDFDYNDLLIHVTQKENGDLEATFERTWYWASYALIMPDGEMIGGKDESLGAAITGPITLGKAPKTSYGMNWQAPRMPNGTEHVLMLDYAREAVRIGGGATQHEVWEETVEPRHAAQSKVNVLFNNGSVKCMDPDELNPEISDIDNRYWTYRRLGGPEPDPEEPDPEPEDPSEPEDPFEPEAD